MSSGRIDHLKGQCARWVELGVHKALCVLVARRGVVCLHEAYGPLGPHGAGPLQRDSIFPMLSISKTITATVLMQLVEDGLVGLTRPVQEYIPEFAGGEKPLVCVHNLLTHTSGIGGGGSEDDSEAGSDAVRDPEMDEWAWNVIRAPLRYRPESEMRYTGANFVVIGEIIRRTSGRSLTELAAERVFGPLGMADSSFVLPASQVDRTVSWNAMAGLGDTTTAEFRAAPTANLGVHSTASDMAAFGQAFLNKGSYGDARILHPSTVAEMTRDQIPGIGAILSVGPYERRRASASWGYGWGISSGQKWTRWPLFPRGSFSHSGGGAMFLWVDPVNEIVGVYLSICRFSPETFDPLSNCDLFVNAVTASIA